MPIRLGFPVRIIGRPGLQTSSKNAHLSIRLVQLRDVLRYLAQINVRFYRLAPVTGSIGAAQLAECAPELAELAALVVTHQVRLTIHLSQGTALPDDNPQRLAAWLALVETNATLLAALEQGRQGPLEGVIVLHLGASSADHAAYHRFANAYNQLSPLARQRLAIEHDDAGFSLGQLLALHQQCGVAVVFDALHWALHNPERLPLDLALGLALATWPTNVRPKIHLSSMRSEAHLLPGKAGQVPRIVPPYPGQHADFVVAEDLRRLLFAAKGLPTFDLMLEAKAGDLALLRLRHEIARLEPALASALG
jgi:UV DNA damage endonuclease